MRLSLTLTAFLFSSLPTIHGQETARSTAREEVVVGGQTIKLPAPVGYERIDGLNPESDRVVEEMLPATNRYLARFDPPKGSTPDYGRSFNVQVLRTLENREIGDRTFGELKQQTKAEIDKAQETIRLEIAKVSGKAEKALQNATDADAALGLSDVAVLGCFDESPSSLGFTMALKVDAKAGDKTTKAKIVVAGMIVPVNGRLIYLYANTDFTSAADRTWAEEAVTAWRDVVVAANPRVEGPTAGGLNFEEIGRTGLSGAVIGGVVALVAMLFKKKKQA
ncbi:MAG: hypothetical protein B7Z37_07550 [Verrucomicrobia bacterium 12-59-8]|nr:MAG: hypothetical protein B7Z37_07550 [Verrucomicrobia bacterium 12-59-8]